MPLRFDRYRMKDGRTTLGADFFNGVFLDIDARIATLEALGVDWKTAIRQVSDYGLLRINEILSPAIESIAASQEQAEQVATQVSALVADIGVLITSHEESENPHPQYLTSGMIATLLAAGGYLTQDAGDSRYVRPEQLESGVPAGAMIDWPGDTPPSGWLERDGSLLLRTDYTDLWSFAQASGNLHTDAEWSAGAWGGFSSGDGSTTFRIPDDRGEFPRYWDHGRGIDSGRALGSRQASQYEAHTHNLSVTSTLQVGTSVTIFTYEDKSNSKAVATRSSLSSGGTETRPRNTARMPIIKY